MATATGMDMEDEDPGPPTPTHLETIIITVPNQDRTISVIIPPPLINHNQPRRELQPLLQSQVSATHYLANHLPQQMRPGNQKSGSANIISSV